MDFVDLHAAVLFKIQQIYLNTLINTRTIRKTACFGSLAGFKSKFLLKWLNLHVVVKLCINKIIQEQYLTKNIT